MPDESITTSQSLALPDEQTFKRDIQAINQFQRIVRECMVPDQDYGIIPGTTKPTLLKPGAEKIAKLLGLADQYIILDRQEDWNKPFFRYMVKCQLWSVRANVVISEGLGECNSMESKYRYRDANRSCPVCGAEAIIKGKEEYGGGWLCFAKKGGCGQKFTEDAPEIINQKIGKVENDDIYSQVNTLLKMAKKRALVDASLSAGRLSNVFTQDMEDIHETQKTAPKKAETKKAEPVKDTTQQGNVAPQAVQQVEDKTAADFQNAGQLIAYASKKKQMPIAEIYKELGIKNTSEIKDIPAAFHVLFG